MNYAIIFAGGVGNRMQNGALPKQFLELNDKPIIIYTLEQFEYNDMIDGIIVVCVAGWEDYLQKKLDFFGITKVTKILTGGSSAIESQFIGLDFINNLGEGNSIVLLHDGVRPLIDQETITKNVECVQKNGSAITVVPAIETISFSGEEGKITKLIEREKCLMARAPQSYLLKNIYNAHLMAQKENRIDFIDSATMMEHYGFDLFTVEGSTSNIKVTTPTDYYIFKAIIDARSNQQVFGEA